MEKELQRQIAKKLEQRIEKEVLEKVDSAILQPQVDKALDKDIRKAVLSQVGPVSTPNNGSSTTVCVFWLTGKRIRTPRQGEGPGEEPEELEEWDREQPLDHISAGDDGAGSEEQWAEKGPHGHWLW